MKYRSVLSPLRGIVTPLVTPLADRDALDACGLERLIEHVLAGGASGLFILGTTGEMAGLSRRLRHELVETACRLVAGRAPVLVGITDTSYVESLALARRAKAAGADAVVAAPPYYFAAAQPELEAYIRQLADEVPLPLLLYNIPSLTKVAFDLPTILAASRHPNVIGVKDSSGSLTEMERLVDAFHNRPEFTLHVGAELLLDRAVCYGAHGGVCGGANVFPRLYVELYEASRDGNTERAAQLDARVRQIDATLFSVGQYPSRTIKGIKCALECLEICSGRMAEPFEAFLPPQRRQIARLLNDLKSSLRESFNISDSESAR